MLQSGRVKGLVSGLGLGKEGDCHNAATVWAHAHTTSQPLLMLNEDNYIFLPPRRAGRQPVDKLFPNVLANCLNSL